MDFVGKPIPLSLMLRILEFEKKIALDHHCAIHLFMSGQEICPLLCSENPLNVSLFSKYGPKKSLFPISLKFSQHQATWERNRFADDRHLSFNTQTAVRQNWWKTRDEYHSVRQCFEIKMLQNVNWVFFFQNKQTNNFWMIPNRVSLDKMRLTLFKMFYFRYTRSDRNNAQIRT